MSCVCLKGRIFSGKHCSGVRVRLANSAVSGHGTTVTTNTVRLCILDAFRHDNHTAVSLVATATGTGSAHTSAVKLHDCGDVFYGDVTETYLE